MYPITLTAQLFHLLIAGKISRLVVILSISDGADFNRRLLFSMHSICLTFPLICLHIVPAGNDRFNSAVASPPAELKRSAGMRTDSDRYMSACADPNPAHKTRNRVLIISAHSGLRLSGLLRIISVPDRRFRISLSYNPILGTLDV